jgi:hypothetical protein
MKNKASNEARVAPKTLAGDHGDGYIHRRWGLEDVVVEMKKLSAPSASIRAVTLASALPSPILRNSETTLVSRR